MRQRVQESISWVGSNFRLRLLQREKGQSLVEMALIMPILLLMFIGVLEVGWALRGYLTLLNVSREAARFVARGRYVDFSSPDTAMVGYGYVLSQTERSLAGQMDVHFTGPDTNATLIITHYLIGTSPPCDNPPCNDNDPPNCPNPPCNSCSDPNKREIKTDKSEWRIWYVDDGTHDFYRVRFGLDRPSNIPTEPTLASLTEENISFNCELNAQDAYAAYSNNSVVIVEILYDQPQLVGIPLISNRFTNPVPLYVHTVMRISSDTRSSGLGG
jgi:hypothetical protein